MKSAHPYAKKQKSKQVYHHLRLIGFGLFVIGLAGFVWHLRSSQIIDVADFLTEDAMIMVHFNSPKSTHANLKKLSSSLSANQSVSQLIQIPDDWLSLVNPDERLRGGLAYFANGDKILMLKLRHPHAITKKLQKFLLPDEEFISTEISFGRLLTPAFSSEMGLALVHDWLIISNQNDRLRQHFVPHSTLSQNPVYQKLAPASTHRSLGGFFINTEQLTIALNNQSHLIAEQPLLQIVSLFVPAIYGKIAIDDQRMSWQLTTSTHPGVFTGSNQDHRSTQDEVLSPALARFAAADTLLFVNGHNLYDKYQNLKKVLSDINSQFVLIFDGVLRAQAELFFGPDFDLEKDLLSKFAGQYGFILDFASPVYPSPYLTFITGIKANDKEKTLSHLHQAISFAQSRLSPQLKTVTLPDGSIRKELVATPPSEIPIRNRQHKSHDYFIAENFNSDQQLSYGLLNNYLLFSTQPTGIENILDLKNNQGLPLSANDDFRRAVVFDDQASSSYSIVNLDKLQQWANLWNNKSIVNFLSICNSFFNQVIMTRQEKNNQLQIKLDWTWR